MKLKPGMKLLDFKKSRRALTLIEILIVIAVITIVVLLLVLPLLGHHSVPRASRISCLSNLRQVGIAFRIWSNDHGDRFPWSVSQTGTLEFATSREVWRHFQIASNELNRPKILICPSDSERTKANSFHPAVSNQNISYFIGLDADETKPNTILSGDRNLSTNSTILSSVVAFENPATVRWTSAIHKDEGNIGLSDGSAMQVSRKTLFPCVTNAGLPLRLSIP